MNPKNSLTTPLSVMKKILFMISRKIGRSSASVQIAILSILFIASALCLTSFSTIDTLFRAGKQDVAQASTATEQSPNSSIIGFAKLHKERRGHSATRLAGGRVLIVGGENQNGLVKASEIFDPASKKFFLTVRPITLRADHAAVLLTDGRVLITGGRNRQGPLYSSEIFDPEAGAFLQSAPLNRARTGHSLTLLADGRVLIVGGDLEGSAEIFDPESQTFTLVESRLSAPRRLHSAALLQNGNVLIAGGTALDGKPLQFAEIFDTAKICFSATQSKMRGTRLLPILRVLPDGKVQVIGGDEERSMEVFNTEGKYFTAYAHLLPDSNSLVGVSDILRARTRAALIHRSNSRDIVIQGRLSGIAENFLDRSDYSVIEIPQSRQALVIGGVNSSGALLSSVVVLSSSSASVTTDKTDYVPGETVVITGAGWQPGETVSMVLHEEPTTHEERVLTSVADSSGNFTNTEFLVEDHDLGVSFTLTATGESSGFTAQTTFTDAQPASVTVTASPAGALGGTFKIDRVQQNGNNQTSGGTTSQTYAVQPGSSFTIHDIQSTVNGLVYVGSTSVNGTAGASDTTTTVTLLYQSPGPTKLAFTTAAITAVVGQCPPSLITVQTQNAGGTPTNPTSNTTVNLSSSSADYIFYSDSSCTTSITSVTIPISGNSAGFYYKDNRAGSPLITASATGLTSAMQTETINKAGTATSVSSSVNPSVFGQSVTFTATVGVTAPGAGAPTGSVTFKDGSSTLGTAALIGDHAAFSTSSFSLALHNITAVYGGDSNFNGGTSPILDQIVNKADSTTSVISSQNPSVLGQMVTFTATVSAKSPGVGTPTGDVTFKDGVTTLGTAALSGGHAAYTTSDPLSVGSHSITVEYGGEGNFNGSTSSALNQQVNKARTATLVSSLPNPSTYGMSVTFTATVSVTAPGAGDPTGTVTFKDGSTVIGAEPLTGDHAAFSTSALFAGQHSITAVYGGDDNFNNSTSTTLVHQVNKADATTSVSSSLNPSVYGQSVIYTATVGVVAPGAGTPTGTVTFKDGSTEIGSGTLIGDHAAFSISTLPAGLHSITAKYEGDGNFNDSTSSPLSQQVNKATPSFSGLSSPTIVFGTTPTSLSGVISAGSLIPTGSVSITLNGVTKTATIMPDGSFSYGFVTGNLIVANSPYAISYAYGGDSNFNSAEGNGALTVNPAPTVSVVSVTPDKQQYSDRVTFSAMLSPAQVSGFAPAATVTFFIGTQNMGTVQLVDISGALTGALADIPLLEPVPFGTTPTGQMAPGPHVVTAIFGGLNPNFTVVNPTATLTITVENSEGNYSGALFASTSCSTCSTATVTLSATVEDISATPDASGDLDAGDIRNAKVIFINRETNTEIATANIGLINPGDTKTGAATYNWNVNIGSAGYMTYTIGIIVKGYYAYNDSVEDTIVTVSKPSQEFITGGGYIVLASSSGLKAGDSGTKNNFGFNVKYNKSGKSLQGNINTIIRRTEADGTVHVYQIKGNSMTSLAVQAAAGTATFNGKANIQDITNPLSPISVDGNATLQVTMTDKGEPGKSDTIGITVWDKNGGMWYSSNWSDGKTVEQLLSGGNLVVH